MVFLDYNLIIDKTGQVLLVNNANDAVRGADGKLYVATGFIASGGTDPGSPGAPASLWAEVAAAAGPSGPQGIRGLQGSKGDTGDDGSSFDAIYIASSGTPALPGSPSLF